MPVARVPAKTMRRTKACVSIVRFGRSRYGVGVGPEHGYALAAAYPNVGDRGTVGGLHQPTVRILEWRYADRSRCFQCCEGQGAGVGRWLNERRPPDAAVLGIGQAVPILDSLVYRQHGVVTPSEVSRFSCEEVPVTAVSARPDHRVDARSAAEDLAHRQKQPTTVQPRVGFTSEAPVERAANVRTMLAGIDHALHIIIGAGFEQQHCGAWVLR